MYAFTFKASGTDDAGKWRLLSISAHLIICMRWIFCIRSFCEFGASV